MRVRVEVTVRGRRLRRWCEAHEAERVKQELRRLLQDQPEIGAPRKAPEGCQHETPTVERLLDLAFPFLWTGSPHRERHLAKARRALGPVLSRPAGTLRTEDLDRCLAALLGRGVKPQTADKAVSHAAVVLRWGQDRGYVPRELKVARTGAQSEQRVRFLSHAEERQLLDLLHRWGRHDVADFVVVALDTGARKGEILRAAPEDIKGGFLRIRRSKNGQPRSVPLTRRAEAALRRRVPWGLSERSLDYWWDRARAEMGLANDPGFVIHALRHTCATRLAIGGLDALKIKEWLGHRSLASTMIYVNLRPEHLTEGLGILERLGMAA